MSSSHVVPLRAADGNFVEAVLHERIGAGYALQVDDEWQAHFAAEEARAVAEGRAVPHLEHGHWEWGEKVKESAHLLSCPTLAIECAGQTQGLMLLKTDGHFGMLPGEIDKPLVYVVYLALMPEPSRKFSRTLRPEPFGATNATSTCGGGITPVSSL